MQKAVDPFMRSLLNQNNDCYNSGETFQPNQLTFFEFTKISPQLAA